MLDQSNQYVSYVSPYRQNGQSHVSHLSPLDIQREQANNLHDQDVTHIIAAEAEFANLFPEDQVDTLIWLQIPSSSSNNLKMTCMGTAYPTNWLLCYNSTVLRESGFEKFVQLLDDERYQKRRASKLLLSGQLGPNGTEIMKKIRYVLDLGPSADSDLRSEHLEALTLPKGIVQYSMMTRLEASRRAPIAAAGGHDDACHCFNMKIRGAKCEEPGYWINGQHKPLTVQGNAVPVTTSSGSVSSPTTGTSDRQAETEMFNAVFEAEPGSEAEAQTQAQAQSEADQDFIFTSSAPYVGNDGNPVLPPPSSPQGPEIMHAPADPPTLKDGSMIGAIWELPLSPEFRIDDYCEIRHIANVIRLLLAMAGKPLLLNSAARVYTIAGLAKLFRLKSSDAYHIDSTSNPRIVTNEQQGGYAFANKLRSLISGWFFEWNNISIVDTLPEECFIIAWNIKLPVVARVAYRILVAEHALQEAGNTNAQPRKFQSRQKTVFGRELSGLLDEDMETMIDHSSEAFVQRILKTRDTHFAEINAHIEELSPAPGGVGGVNHTTDFDPLPAMPAMFQPFQGTVNKLQQTAQALSDFVTTEQNLASFDPDDLWEPQNFPIVNALAAVCRLLDQIAFIVRVCFPRHMPESDLLQTTYTEDVQKSLSYYVRQNTLHKNWFVHVYNDLPNDKKTMTAVYWRLLARSVEDKLSTEFGNAHFLELVTAVNESLLTALVYNVPLGTPDTRANLRLDLLERLQPIIGYHITLVSLESMDEFRGFQATDIRQALFNHASQLYKKFYERNSFVPEFELAMLTASPHLLLSLNADEFRFLPLWAGGDNDGTGAVFEPALPTAHLGPISPGPEYHTGTTNTSMSTPSIDDALSMAGPPSISEAGNTERYRDTAMSDAGGTARGHGYGDGDSDNDGQSVSSSFIMVRNFDGLHLAAAQGATVAATAPSSSSWNYSLPSNASRAVQDGHSTLTGTSGASFATPSSSSTKSSVPSVALTTSSFDDMVVVRPAVTAAAAAAAAPPSTNGAGISVDFDFDDENDGIYNYEDDDDVEDQEYYDDDDDDAKSDDTVMPDREEVEQAMRQDQEMQNSGAK